MTSRLRRGLIYGTSIVDLETHRVLDLLPDRTAATVISWLKAHPEIELISRDRGKDYATAARLGAPQAVQVADRWHRHHNLSEALTLLFARHRTEIKHASRALAPTPAAAEVPLAPELEKGLEAAAAPPVPFVLGHAYRAPKIQALQDSRHAQRLVCYEPVVTLRNQPVTPAEIAERLSISTRTVARWLALDGIPRERQRRRRPSLLDPDEAYVLCRWQAGWQNGAQLWRELVDRGYTGSPRSLYHFLARLPEPPLKPKPNPLKPKRVVPPPGPYDHLTTKQAVWLFVRPRSEFPPAEQETCAFLRQVHPHLETAYHLAQDFITRFDQQDAEGLDPWINRARGSHIPELVRFGTGLRQDHEAVRASLVLPYRQGVVEGQVNRLKLIKRMLYGRACFPLLQKPRPPCCLKHSHRLLPAQTRPQSSSVQGASGSVEQPGGSRFREQRSSSTRGSSATTGAFSASLRAESLGRAGAGEPEAATHHGVHAQPKLHVLLVAL